MPNISNAHKNGQSFLCTGVATNLMTLATLFGHHFSLYYGKTGPENGRSSKSIFNETVSKDQPNQGAVLTISSICR